MPNKKLNTNKIKVLESLNYFDVSFDRTFSVKGVIYIFVNLFERLVSSLMLVIMHHEFWESKK